MKLKSDSTIPELGLLGGMMSCDVIKCQILDLARLLWISTILAKVRVDAAVGAAAPLVQVL